MCTDSYWQSAQHVIASCRYARQVGKSTLAQEVVADRGFDHSLTLDNQADLDAARNDPVGFLADLTGTVFIDEIQRAPNLMLAIKQRVDLEQRPGQFLLTGSANVLTAPKVHDALIGRTALIALWPLAQAEIEGVGGNVVDALLAGEPPRVRNAPVGRAAFVDRITRGGYPRVLHATTRQRAQFFADYLTSTLDRDLRDLADARKLAEMPSLLRLLATRVGNIYSAHNVARSLGLAHDTVRGYTRLLEIDIVLEANSGDIAAIEVKASATPRARDCLWAVPVSGLWSNT